MSGPSPQKAWLPFRRHDTRPRMRLFCLPYAGGNAAVFRDWPPALTDIEVCAVQYPGRGTRFREPPARRMDALVEPLLAEAIAPLLDVPFVLFGHSMGAVIAFELAQRIHRAGLPAPALVILSARGPRGRDEPIHAFPDEALAQRLRALGGTPPEILDNPELLEIVLPIVRADLELLETHTLTPSPVLDCPIVAFGSEDDPHITPDDLQAWRAMTTGPFSLQRFPGQHFFLHTAQESVLSHIRRACSRIELASGATASEG